MRPRAPPTAGAAPAAGRAPRLPQHGGPSAAPGGFTGPGAFHPGRCGAGAAAGRGAAGAGGGGGWGGGASAAAMAGAARDVPSGALAPFPF